MSYQFNVGQISVSALCEVIYLKGAATSRSLCCPVWMKNN